MVKFLPILLILFSCTSQDRQKNNDISKKDTLHTYSLTKGHSLPIDSIGYFRLDGDSLIIPSFEIEVDLSPKADKKLKEDKETIIVAAFFSGHPKDTTSEEYRKDGEVFVTSFRIELGNTRIAKFEGVKFSKTSYDSLADKDIRLLINIFSGRKSSRDNLLDCDILSNRMSKVKGKRFTMKGKLIYNDD